MSDAIDPTANSQTTSTARAIPPWAFVAIVGTTLVLVVIYVNLTQYKVPPPPSRIMTDAWLVRAHQIAYDRCLNCHGDPSTPGGMLTRGDWSIGDDPRDVYRLVVEGSADGSMPGFADVLNEEDLRGVTAYCYVLAGLPVPELLREPVANWEPSEGSGLDPFRSDAEAETEADVDPASDR